MAQVNLESSKNELVLLQSQFESFREAIAKENSLSLKLQEWLVLSEGKVRQLQQHLGEEKADVECWRMMTDQMQQEQDVAQLVITAPKVNKLVENVFVEIHQMVKVHQEATYYMGCYYQAFPNED